MDLLYLVERELKRRHYSPKTVNTYLHCIKRFLAYTKKEPRKLSRYDVDEYLAYLNDRKSSASTLNVYLQSIRFAMVQILNKRFFANMPYSKVPKRIPDSLSKEEIRKLFDAILNKRYSLMVRLLYGSGMRISELLQLKVEDLDFERSCGVIQKGKGAKGRIFILPLGLKVELLQHIKDNSLPPESYLFTSRNGKPYSIRTIQNILLDAAKLAKIRRVHPHMLRHSFATHLIEDGNDIIAVQSLLGHNSVDTTMRYVHSAKARLHGIKSPYDGM